LDSSISKEKIIEIKSYVEKRVDTGEKTYIFEADEWLDLSDSPETLILHSNLPFLALTIDRRVTISRMAQKTLDAAAVKVRELNHTDIPHRNQTNERDTLHELSQLVSVGDIPAKILVMNCSQNERPAFAKKRYFLLTAFLGLSSFHRNKMNSKLFETTFKIEKHVESVKAEFK